MRNEIPSGFSIVEMLGRSNFLALVGHKQAIDSTSITTSSNYSPYKVVIWDDSQGCAVIELEFKAAMECVKLTKDFIVTASHGKLYIYSFSNEPELLKIMNCASSMNTGKPSC